MLFKLRIFDKHERQFFDKGRWKTAPLDDKDDTWQRFDMVIETDVLKIDCFREYVLFDESKNPTRCLKIFLSDGSYVLGAYTLETFRQKWEKHLKGETSED